MPSRPTATGARPAVVAPTVSPPPPKAKTSSGADEVSCTPEDAAQAFSTQAESPRGSEVTEDGTRISHRNRKKKEEKEKEKEKR